MERDLERNNGETLPDYVKRVLPIRGALGEFYNSKAVKKRNFDRKRALQCEMDLAVDGVLRMVGKHRAEKVDGSLVFCIGDDFQMNPSKPSLYSKFQTYLVRKARELGYKVVFRNEYYTSQKFPGGYDTFIDCSDNVRVKYCSELDIHINRDIMVRNVLNIRQPKTWQIF